MLVLSGVASTSTLSHHWNKIIIIIIIIIISLLADTMLTQINRPFIETKRYKYLSKALPTVMGFR